MRIYISSDHAGFEMKHALISYLRQFGEDPQMREQRFDVQDLGAHRLDGEDDYPDFVLPLARRVAAEPLARGIVLGASGEGEAMAANRVRGARAAVYYGEPVRLQTDAEGLQLDIIESTRAHNDANILSLGARFITEEEAKRAVKKFLELPFSNEERHVRRLAKLDQ